MQGVTASQSGSIFIQGMNPWLDIGTHQLHLGAQPRPAAAISLKVLCTARQGARATQTPEKWIFEDGANGSVVSYLCGLGYAT